MLVGLIAFGLVMIFVNPFGLSASAHKNNILGGKQSNDVPGSTTPLQQNNNGTSSVLSQTSAGGTQPTDHHHDDGSLFAGSD
jgi:hypothetical protein